MNRLHSPAFFVGVVGIIFLLLPNVARADFSKIITVTPGVQTQAVATWYYANCTTVLGVGSYTMNVAPNHGTVTFGSVSGPLPGCPTGSPSLPAVAAYYTWFDTTPGSSSDYFQLTYSVNGLSELIDITVNLTQPVAPPPAPTPPANCPIDVRPVPVTNPAVSPFPTLMTATFFNAQPLIPDVANQCGFDSFDWQQKITYLPSPSPFSPNDPSLINPLNLVNNGAFLPYTIKAPPEISDPAPGGWTYLGSFNPYPFVDPVYPHFWFTPGCKCTLSGTGQCGPGFCASLPLPYQVSPPCGQITPCGTDFGFTDAPVDPYLKQAPPSTFPADGTYIAFRTSLVGVSKTFSEGSSLCDPTQIASSLYCTVLYVWTWNTTFNGKAGGISQTASLYPPDPESGTGGITITSINGVQLPTVLLPSQVSVVASGLAYSRVSQTFTGTVTISNISEHAINGPLQILFLGISRNATLMNATANISGTPYVTVPGITSLAPGHSATVSVQFQNPSNVSIHFTPTIYSGSIN